MIVGSGITTNNVTGQFCEVLVVCMPAQFNVANGHAGSVAAGKRPGGIGVDATRRRPQVILLRLEVGGCGSNVTCDFRNAFKECQGDVLGTVQLIAESAGIFDLLIGAQGESKVLRQVR